MRTGWLESRKGGLRVSGYRKPAMLRHILEQGPAAVVSEIKPFPSPSHAHPNPQNLWICSCTWPHICRCDKVKDFDMRRLSWWAQ